MAKFILSDDLLERCAGRAAGYDRENRFFFEDFDELREAKYLLAAMPKEFGGAGLNLAETCREQRRRNQLFRDARCGRFHPANALLAHEIVAKTTLGIDLGEEPRWG